MARADSIHPLPCPCGEPVAYAECCGRWHAGPMRLQAPDALQLMRSRYSAYVLKLVDYLLDTWHPRTRPALLDLGSADIRWLGLEVRRHAELDATHATVEFVARSQQGGRATRMHELSRFERLGVQWVYVDGIDQRTR